MTEGSGAGQAAGPEGSRVRSGPTGRARGAKTNDKPEPAEPAGRTGPVGTILRAGGKDGPQRIESRGKRWTDEAETLFLDGLAASCNVAWSARRTGFSKEAVYQRRRRDPAFAERWRQALAQGYARLEAALVKAAVETMEGRLPDPESPIPKMSAAEAIAVLKLHRAEVHGIKSPGWRGRPRSLDEVKGSILKKLSAIERHRAGGPEGDGGDPGQA